jgi:cytidylate kinase
MPVITIRGQMGSGAPEVGRIVADKLQFDYIDREIIAEVADNLKRKYADVARKETPPVRLFERIREALSQSYPIMPDPERMGLSVYLPAWEIPLDDERYVKSLEVVIKKLAENQSVVIRGRGSQFILKDFPGAFHVLMVAPEEVRIKRMMESMKLNEADAGKEMARSDSSHRQFIKRYFKKDLEDPVNYDLVVNTSNLSYKDIAAIIISAYELKLKATQIKSTEGEQTG